MACGGCARNGPAYISNLADRHGDVACEVDLPPGFHPLAGLDPNDPSDFVDGWPRYIVSNADNAVMVYVPGGEFVMGTGNPADGPTGPVRVNHFYVDMYEVNNAQFARFREASKHRTTCEKLMDPLGLFTRSSLRRSKEERAAVQCYAGHKYEYEICSPGGCGCPVPRDIDYYRDFHEAGHNSADPVRNVSWWEAWYYANWAGKALPTEAQWELAARGLRERRAYPWGDSIDDAHLRCNFDNAGEIFDGYRYVAPVGAFPGGASPYGVLNMAGNVWEWCADWYDATAGMRPRSYPWRDPDPIRPDREAGGRLETAQSSEGATDPDAVYVQPAGPFFGTRKVVRGGAYTSAVARCTVYSRAGVLPDAHNMNVGFRCVLPLP